MATWQKWPVFLSFFLVSDFPKGTPKSLRHAIGIPRPARPRATRSCARVSHLQLCDLGADPCAVLRAGVAGTGLGVGEEDSLGLRKGDDADAPLLDLGRTSRSAGPAPGGRTIARWQECAAAAAAAEVASPSPACDGNAHAGPAAGAPPPTSTCCDRQYHWWRPPRHRHPCAFCGAPCAPSLAACFARIHDKLTLCVLDGRRCARRTTTRR